MYFLLFGLNTVLCLILLWYWNTLAPIGVILLLALLFEIFAAFLQSQFTGRNEKKTIFRKYPEQHGYCNEDSDPVKPRNVQRNLPRTRNRSNTELRTSKEACIAGSVDNDKRRVDDRLDLTSQALKKFPGYKTGKQNTKKSKQYRRKTVIKFKQLVSTTHENIERNEPEIGHVNKRAVDAETDVELEKPKFVIGNRKREKNVKVTDCVQHLKEDDESDVNSIKGIEEVGTDLRNPQESECTVSTEIVCVHDAAASNSLTETYPSEMAARNIARLIQEGQDAFQAGNKEGAKQKALQAIAGINIEKEKLLTGKKTDINEQQLGDWYGGCSFVMNKIGENITATKCFYTATVFDPSWDVTNHKNVYNVLWTSLVFSKDKDDLSKEYKGLRRLLMEIDDLAKLAESRGKWNVCAAADGDINKIFSYLMRQGLADSELIKQPGRKASLWRSARCFLRMGMQEDARKLCSTILQHACDYDDPEAFEIWAFSLYATKDFDLALEKCELALNYCKDKSYRQRLEAFRSEIQKQIAVNTRPEQNGEAGDTGSSAATNKQWVTQGNKNKRKSRHAKANAHTQPSGSSRSTPDRGTPNVSRTKPETQKAMSKFARKLKYETGEIIYQRARYSSTCSTATTTTDGSEFETSSQFDDSEQELSSDDESFDYTSSSREETPDASVAPDIDPEEEAMKEEMTFYEQSMRFYQQNDDSTEYLGKADSDEKLLKYGIKLNMSYMHQFEDKHPDVLKRDQFYPDFLDEGQLKQKLLLNPKKYIRCVIQIEGSHEAYCTPVDTNDSIHIIEISGRSKIGQVFNEDEVVVEILDEDSKDKKDKRFGMVIGIWNRQRHKDTKHPVFICTLDDIESNLVRPMCKTIPKLHIVDREISQKYTSRIARRYKVETYDYDEVAETLCNPKIFNLNPADLRSYIFLVAFISWSPRHIYPRGAIIKMLPTGLSQSTGLMILNLQHEVPTLYRKATVDQIASVCNRLGDEPSSQLLQGRRDLTGLNTFTIDPPDSKDLDDALSVERIDGGYKVGVHIADVAMYVPQNSPLDEESKQRATTFYPGIRRPRNMLPEPFSTKVCSLLPDKKRLTISLFFYLTNTGRQMQMEGSNFEVTASYIRSKRQLTYSEAQEIILSPRLDEDNDLTKDIKTLFKVAKEVRKRRLGNAMFAMDLDWEESEEGESDSQTVEAHYLVEEFMIMSNRKIAEWLLRHKFKGYSQCIPLRSQPPPSQENLEEFLQKNSCYVDILLRLQGKQLGPKRPDFRECLRDEKRKTVMIRKNVWDAMVKSPKTASEFIRKDDLHPLQLTVYQQWLAIQERAGYRCSGSIKGEEDGKHASLNMYPYTHFTSPIRRYNDLIVHRLVHAAFKNKPCPYEKRDIESICVHINSVTKRAKEYEKGCKALQKAIEFKTSPRMLNCCVDDVSDRGVTLCSPWLKFVPKPHRELTFNLLDMGHKPESVEDPETKWIKVKAMWRKRLYNFSEAPDYPPDKGNEHKLNPHRGVVLLPMHEWARMLRATTDEHEDDLARAVKNAGASHHRGGFDDVSTECRNPLKIQPNTKFSMLYSRGQQLKIQMSASPNKGIITPKPVLYSMTNNIKFCLQHTENPVLHLYRYVTRSTCDKYQDVRSYLERWLPLILMEAATGIVRNEESCCINNVTVKFLKDRKGKFSLGLAECEIRNIELSGTVSEDTDDVRCDETAGSYDWLCLKAPLPNLKKSSRTFDFENLNAFWIGHASVIKVVKRKQQHSAGGNINITFQLHDKAPDLPSNFPADTRFSVEVLKKSEVDRRTESFIKELPSQSDSLAAKIALNKRIPDFDRSRAHIASLRHNQDLFFDTNHDDPGRRRTVLPPNNAMQQDAVNKALTSRFTLIQGPPGTGKTYTGIKLMYLFDKINYQLSREGHARKQVLFCGPSNRSVDLVAKWMLQRMEHYKPNFIRVYGRSIEAIDFPIPGRTFLSKRSTRSSHTDPDLKSVALHHLIREKGKKYAEEIKARDKFFKEHNYEPMPELVKEYVHTIREASIDEIRKYDVILCTTAVGANPKVLEATNVYQVIVDEAGMCPEPQCLVPIIATKAEQVVLIGDHMQLRPIIMCKEAALLGLDKSLFERYATTDSSKNVQFTMLTQQYRMNPEICRFPSKQFYESALKTMPGLWRDETLHIWPQDAKGVYPHVLVHVEGEEHVLTVSTEDGNEQSRSNDAEIDHVIMTYNYLKREIPNESIQILSQYNSQCSEIKRRLKMEKVQEYDEIVSTVVSSQGGEWNYVIFSTVRSLPEYKIEKNPTLGWCKHNLGFITDRNQVNVALTRARKGLIIIGNKNLLVCDYVWKRLIKHYEQRGCIKSAEEFPPKNIRKTRQQIMEEAQERIYRRFGDSIYEKGEATSYEGAIDNDYNEDDMWNRRFGNPARRNLGGTEVDNSALIIKPLTDDALTIWPEDEQSTYPHVLVHVEGEGRRLTADDWINDLEVKYAVNMYAYLKRANVNESVQILSQSTAQCSEIKRRLKLESEETDTDFDTVVRTVTSSEGMEWNYVIFSTVRSLLDQQFKTNPGRGWCKYHLGCLTDRKEVNTALTRARKGLIIIGNKNLLSCDSAWRKLIQYYEDRNCVKDPGEFPPDEGLITEESTSDEAATSEAATSDGDYSENDM
ncbi:helicase with zinc finger domain 2-like isoform X2 [Mercenaria mercenaria]|uniref:helicase with zinc finger domain 2-like isoform X2 n=1 Tax=Mercenaria mercenaria TaxID=6596 RepID=UPI00234F0B4C|nr:helicase with zinc finger domain 2-like isoform X2 [Mercenaria mercenaria]